jgi:hypothetical protein
MGYTLWAPPTHPHSSQSFEFLVLNFEFPPTHPGGPQITRIYADNPAAKGRWLNSALIGRAVLDDFGSTGL